MNNTQKEEEKCNNELVMENGFYAYCILPKGHKNECNPYIDFTPPKEEECTCGYGDTRYKDWRIYGHKKQCNIYINPESLEDKGEGKCACGEQIILGNCEIELAGICHRLKSPCYVITPPTDSNWEEEFDKLFSEDKNGKNSVGLQYIDAPETKLKSFIKSTLQQERQKERESWIEKIEKIDTSGGGNGRRVVAQILQALSSNKPSKS
jgi:hypothetical protein